MKIKFCKLAFLLTCLYSLNIFGITKKYIKINFLENIKLRFLLDTKLKIDKSLRKDKGDLNSIENCEADYKYFYQYITGYNVIFDKDIDNNGAVSNHILTINIILQNILKRIAQGKASKSDYINTIGAYFIFVAIAGVGIILWILNWTCWQKKWCCYKVLHNETNARVCWWFSFIFLCGIIACCISGLAVASRF